MHHFVAHVREYNSLCIFKAYYKSILLYQTKSIYYTILKVYYYIQRFLTYF